jgi:hypothetical protein
MIHATQLTLYSIMASLEADYNFFLETDTSEYKGKWIAVSNNRIISVGKDVKQVSEVAKKNVGSNKFLLIRVPSEETMIF